MLQGKVRTQCRNPQDVYGNIQEHHLQGLQVWLLLQLGVKHKACHQQPGAEAGGIRVPGQPGLHSETLSQKKKKIRAGRVAQG
jgi:hypothetical protein